MTRAGEARIPKAAEDDVSKRSKVQLTAGWWKTAWPLDDKPRNYNEMMNCLKTYKAERRGRSVQDLEEALEDIGKSTSALQTEATKI